MSVQTTMRGWMGAIVPAATLVFVGCGQSAKTPTTTGQNQQQEASPDPTYPKGPYGYEVNSTIADFKLIARVDTNNDGSLLDETPKTVWLSDLRKNSKAIVLTASAEWCVPCNEEQPDLVQMFKDINQNGQQVAILEALVQSKDYSPANNDTITRWATKYKIPFNLGVDPTGVLMNYYDIDAFPMGMVIRTSDMQIYWQANGAAVPDIKTNVQAIINGQ